MKQFTFDRAIYKKLNESVFDDDDDDLLNDDDYNVLDKLLTNDDILDLFNKFYEQSSNAIGKAYGCWSPLKFANIKDININGITYKLITKIEKRASYVTYPKIKNYVGPIILIGSQELVDFMEKYNILIHIPMEYEDDEFYLTKTYVYENVTLSSNYIQNMYIAGKHNEDEFKEIPTLLFKNSKVDTNAIQTYLNQPFNVVYFGNITSINGFGCTSLNMDVQQSIQLTIENDNVLKNFRITYNNKLAHYNGKLQLINCRKLTNVHIEEHSDFISLNKLKIDKCPNINLETLMLPNHNTRSYNIQLLNDLDRLKAINFRGPLVTWFYYNSEHKDYKNKWYDSKSYINPYKKKGE